MSFVSKLVNIGVEVGKRKSHKFCSVIVAAGGSSSRMEGINKQFVELEGIPVLVRTLMVYEHNSLVDEIVIVTKKEDIGRVSSLCADFSINKVTKIVPGGESRTQSVAHGLDAVSKKAKLIAIADGARPLITGDIITETITQAARNAAAAPGIPIVSTVKRIENGCVVSTVPRDDLVQIQTPQVFEASLYRAAMENVIKTNAEITDDCMAVELMGIPIKLTKGSSENIKITTQFDLVLAKQILRSRGKNK